ncbi:MAG: hypothetical protein B6D55_02525 [Candidatus Omnitrophica bacterium 4484_70.2]|nr:MAG: hypothetical protein B6D55_02525 [Candidatus Omnitrophica bacterium 4484_70.2]
MSFRKLYFTIAIFLFFSFKAFGEEIPNISSLESLLEEWLNLKKEYYKERQDWQEKKELLESEYKLLMKQKEMLLEEKSRYEKEKTSYEQERVNLIKDKREFEKVFERMLPVLRRAEKDLKIWEKIIPASLKKKYKLSALFERLTEPERLAFTERLQTILNLYEKIESLNNNILLVTEILSTPKGNKKQFEIIYVGLSVCYGVSLDGENACWGRFTPDGVVWKWQDNLVSKIKKAIEFYRKEKIAEFIFLPAEVEKR